VGHELRNSVAPLLLLAEQLAPLGEQADVPPALARWIPTLNKQLRKFVATLQRVAQVSDLRAGKVALAPVALDLLDRVATIRAQLQAEADSSGTAFVVSGDASVTGTWDPDRVDQILHHLLHNAIRYAGGGAIEIDLRGDPSHATITIRDHGPGLQGDLATVFQRFEHASPRRAGGFGVGLFVVHRSSMLLGGSVAAEHADGGGARFRVVLPRG